MFERTGAILARYEELNRLLASPEVHSDPDLLRAYGQEQSELAPIVDAQQRYTTLEEELAEARAMRQGEHDPEMLARRLQRGRF